MCIRDRWSKKCFEIPGGVSRKKKAMAVCMGANPQGLDVYKRQAIRYASWCLQYRT